jgi:hypothetical protein
MSRRPCSLGASALVHRNIDDDRARLHALEHFPRDDDRRSAAWHEQGANDDIRAFQFLSYVVVCQ